jgi:hypothetical protein
MGSCCSSPTYAKCDNSREKTSSASIFSSSRRSISSKFGSLAPSQRERLESEADQMVDRFTRSRSTRSIGEPSRDLRTTTFPEHRGRQILKKGVPAIRQSLLAENNVLLKSADEEAITESSTGEDKGTGSVTETAETNVSSPEFSDENEEILTKRIDSKVKSVSKDNSPPLNGGSALTGSSQQEMGSFFGRDFSNVRIHNDSKSHQYTHSIGALAATKSNHIFFSDRASPTSDKPLLVHELTHVVQQNRAPKMSSHSTPFDTGINTANTQPVQMKTAISTPASDISNAPVDWQLYQATICRGKTNEHSSTQPRDFPATYISSINVSINQQKVTLGWAGPSIAEAEQIVQDVTGDGIINCSTGAGVRGETSCNDETHSKSTGSCCTPIGSFTLGGQSCVTPRLSLQNFSGFQRSGIGFHYYSSVPSHPASHGCVRLHRGASKIIFDNARTGHTTVNVSGSYSRSYSRHRSCS